MILYALKHKQSGLWGSGQDEYENIFSEEIEIERYISESLVPLLAYCPRDLVFEDAINKDEFEIVPVSVFEIVNAKVEDRQDICC